MTQPVATDSPDTDSDASVLYGKALQRARKQKNISVEEVAQVINVSVEVIEALESSATEGLPPPAYVRGYLRAYARHVEVPVEQVLKDFAQAVPHQSETPLRARSRLPQEASSGSPLVKLLTRALLLFIVFALLYSVYHYYTNKVNDFAGQQSRTPPAVEQHARLGDDDTLLLMEDDGAVTELPVQPEFRSLAETLAPGETPEQQLDTADTAAEQVAAQPEPPKDEILIHADADSWVEITDASGRNLFYNMLRQGQKRELVGEAPFNVFFGNAPAISLRVNDVAIDMRRFIRANNVARFRVAIEDGKAVFLRRR